MAHNIMQNGKEKTDAMFYGYQDKPAWHELGTVNEIPQTAQETMDNNFKGAFTVETRPVTVTLNGEATETGDFAIVRSKMADPDSKEVVFGYCTSRYNPLQPIDLARIFDENVRQRVETMAFLGDGNDMFISWKMPKFEVVKDDEIQLYGMVRSGFDTLKGTRLFTSTYRPVCQNTINMAQNWAKKNTDGKGRGEIWTGKHVNKNLARDLGYWMKCVVDNSNQEAGLIESFFKKLADTPVKNDSEVHEILYNAFPPADSLGGMYPVELRTAKETAISDESQKQAAIRDLVFELFAGRGTAITPTYWGVLNATSEAFCNVIPSKKPVASSIMFGNRQAQIMKVVNVLKKRIDF